MGDNKELNPHTFHEGYMKRLRGAERELTNVEKRVKTLATKHASICAERESLTEQIRGRERTVSALLGQRSDLLGDWSLADFNGDTQAKENIQKRRAELDEQVEDKEQELSSLRTSLDALEDTSREAAELQVRLEQLNYGNAYSFATELRNILVRHELSLKSRKKEAERMLPTVDPATLEATREELVDGYLEKKQAHQESLERAQQERERQQQEHERRANTPYVGWSGYVDQFGERLPRGSVDADGTVKPQYQNKQGTRRAMPKNRTVEVVK